MKEKIMKIISNYSGVKGIIIEYKTGERITINEREVFPSASLIKLFITYAIEKELYSKKIKIKNEEKVGGCGVLKILKDDLELSVRDLISLMLSFSDNTATNILIDYIGIEKINQKIKEAGFNNTILGRKMFDEAAKLQGKENYTTPEDVDKVLKILYEDKEILEMLKNQGYHNKIDLFFAREERAKLAHKTGEVKCVEHDAGRLYYDDKWVDIIILTKDLESNGDGIRINSLVGKEIFDSIN